MAKHAKLAPSASERWINCPGSVALIRAISPPSSTSKFAIEGTVAHAVAEFMLLHGPDEAFSLIDETGAGAFNIEGAEDITITHEMFEYVSYYWDYVNQYTTKEDRYIEYQAPLFYSPKERGTIDTVGFNWDGSVINIIDLKYGKGVPVSAHKNTQLLIYAISALDYFTILYDIKSVNLHIVQPRTTERSTMWTLTMEDIESWRKRIEWAVAHVSMHDAPRLPGEKQCRWCPVKAQCVEFAKHNVDNLGTKFEALTPVSIDQMSIAEAADIYEHKSEIDEWLKAIHDWLYAEAMAGHEIPGHHLKWGRTNRVWADEKEAEKILLKYFSKHDIIQRKVITAPQSDKLLKRKDCPAQAKKEVTQQITKTQAKLVLARGEGENVKLCNFDKIEETQK